MWPGLFGKGKTISLKVVWLATRMSEFHLWRPKSWATVDFWSDPPRAEWDGACVDFKAAIWKCIVYRAISRWTGSNQHFVFWGRPGGSEFDMRRRCSKKVWLSQVLLCTWKTEVHCTQNKKEDPVSPTSRSLVWGELFCLRGHCKILAGNWFKPPCLSFSGCLAHCMLCLHLCMLCFVKFGCGLFNLENLNYGNNLTLRFLEAVRIKERKETCFLRRLTTSSWIHVWDFFSCDITMMVRACQTDSILRRFHHCKGDRFFSHQCRTTNLQLQKAVPIQILACHKPNGIRTGGSSQLCHSGSYSQTPLSTIHWQAQGPEQLPADGLAWWSHRSCLRWCYAGTKKTLLERKPHLLPLSDVPFKHPNNFWPLEHLQAGMQLLINALGSNVSWKERRLIEEYAEHLLQNWRGRAADSAWTALAFETMSATSSVRSHPSSVLGIRSDGLDQVPRSHVKSKTLDELICPCHVQLVWVHGHGFSISVADPDFCKDNNNHVDTLARCLSWVHDAVGTPRRIFLLLDNTCRDNIRTQRWFDGGWSWRR